MIETFNSPEAPKPLGAYSHAAMVGNLIFVCGMGPRHFKTNEIPGLSLDAQGRKISYNIKAETQATLENLNIILKGLGRTLQDVIEMNVYLTDMKDFVAMNEVYAQYFKKHQPVRTTLGVQSLPGNISIEIKAIAVRPQ